MTTIKAVDRRDPMVFPAEDYALAWVACLAGYLPGLKYRSREALLRLSGWPHWNDMVAACNPAKHCVTEDIGRNPAQRLASLAEHRAIIIHEFGVKPAFANTFLWANPLGSYDLVPLRAAAEGALYREGERPSDKLSEILQRLDSENLALIPGTEDNIIRAFTYTCDRVYLAMFEHLGWALKLDDGSDFGIPPGLPISRLGDIQDPELGAVPVFLTGMTPDPYLPSDETTNAIYNWITSPTGGKQTTAVVLFRQPQLQVIDKIETSIFGSFIEGHSAFHLTLAATSKSLGSVVGDVVPGESLPVPEHQDRGFELAMRFVRAMERYCDFPELHMDGIAQPVVLAGGTGWGCLKLPVRAID